MDETASKFFRDVTRDLRLEGVESGQIAVVVRSGDRWFVYATDKPGASELFAGAVREMQDDATPAAV